MVGICMITYNHEKYIEAAIMGVLMQETSFDYQLVIGEDCSTDNTRAICEQYANQYPDRIKLLPSEKNWGMMPNFIRTLQSCTDKYIALLDGDDYWTDPLKLQKQVDFLEKNLDYAICFHNCLEKHEDSSLDFLYCKKQEDTTTLPSLFYRNYIPTCSSLFRNNVKKIPEWYVDAGVGDWSLHLINAQFGKIKYLDEVMGVHRIHVSGTWSHNKQIENINVIIALYNLLFEKFEPAKKYIDHFKEGKANLIEQAATEYRKGGRFFMGLKNLIQAAYLHPKKSVFSPKQYYSYIRACLTK